MYFISYLTSYVCFSVKHYVMLCLMPLSSPEIVTQYSIPRKMPTWEMRNPPIMTWECRGWPVIERRKCESRVYTGKEQCIIIVVGGMVERGSFVGRN